MTVLVIVDALRWDIASDPDIMPNLNSFKTLEPIWANNNTTEPCVTSILSGEDPLTHGILGIIQSDAYQRAKMVIDEPSWYMLSPAIIFRDADVLGEFGTANNIEKFDENVLDGEVSVIHLMDVHDYEGEGCMEEFYNEHEELPRCRAHQEIQRMVGWNIPWEEKTDFIQNDAGRIKALYKCAANRVDNFIGELKQKCDEEDRTMIVTADHGEAFGEQEPYPQPVFRHIALFDSVLRVPLAVNRDMDIPYLTDQTDIRNIIDGEDIANRDMVIHTEHTWQSGIRITTRDSHLINYWNKAYDYPDMIGDENLEQRLEFAKEKFPTFDPTHKTFNQ